MKAEYSGHIDITLMNVFERLENITLYKVSKAGKVKKRVLNATGDVQTLTAISLHARCGISLVVRSPRSTTCLCFFCPLNPTAPRNKT